MSRGLGLPGSLFGGAAPLVQVPTAAGERENPVSEAGNLLLGSLQLHNHPGMDVAGLLPRLTKAETGLEVTRAVSTTPQGDSFPGLELAFPAPLHLPVVGRNGRHPKEHQVQKHGHLLCTRRPG